MLREVTPDLVMMLITPLQDEWEKDEDWWFGVDNEFKDHPYGFDVHVHREEEGDDLMAYVYELGEGKDDIRQSTYVPIFDFSIERYRKGMI